MRKVIILCHFLIMFGVLSSQVITIDEAKKLALDFFSYKFGKTNIETIEVQPVRENDTVFFYIVSIDNSLSLLLSSHMLAGPFLAYSTQGIFQLDPENHTLQLWLSQYKQIIRYVFRFPNDSTYFQRELKFEQSQAKPTNPTNGFYLIKTQWAQRKDCKFGCTYNKFVNDHGKGSFCPCGKCPAGCVAVALGQIMRYWAQPAFRFDWCNMPEKLECNSPMVQINAIARLLADIGDKVDMKYCVNDECQSGASPIKAKNVFHEYGYTEAQYKICLLDSQNGWLNRLRSELLLKRPIFYSGCKIKDSKLSCHAFICDGFDLYHPNFFHFNWGWGGFDDGFFYIFLLTSKPVSLFPLAQSAIFNIYPTRKDTCDKTLIVSENYQFSMLSSNLYYFPTFYAYIKTSQPPDNVIISSGEKVIYSATDEIILEEGFIAEEGSEFIAQIIPCPASCKLANPTPNLDKYYTSESNNFSLQDSIYNTISIYPNPTSSLLFITINSFSECNKLQSISIIDITGKTLIHQPILRQYHNNTSFTFDLSLVEKGVYFIKVQFQEKEIWKILIKN